VTRFAWWHRVVVSDIIALPATYVHAGDAVLWMVSSFHRCGVKVRLGAALADRGAHEAAAYERARELASAVHMPLMTHHTGSTVGQIAAAR
jgi:hypothetical protein